MMQGILPINDLDEAWIVAKHGAQLRAVRRAGERLRERFLIGPRCVSVRTFSLFTLAFPSRYAFGAAAITPAPFVLLTHRCVFVQFLQNGNLKNLLFSPSDFEGTKATPFFARMTETLGARVAHAVARTFDPLEAQLLRLGVRAEEIDYLAFNNCHAQDLRGLLGTEDGLHAPRFPNATLLAPKAEWEDWDDLHPLQRAWYVRDGKSGARTNQLTLTTGDLALGDGVMLVRTPGHTSGNQTLFLLSDSGIWGISENGPCADSWSPLESHIKGLSFMCKKQELDVIPNADTPEYTALHYTSMVLERTVACRVRRAPAFVQVFPASEVTPSLMAPGLTPSLLHRAITHGEVARKPGRVTQPLPSAAEPPLDAHVSAG